ncbi:MAG: type II secretion system F family protein [Candidatus Omnitrophica bacterium]|nr:type II secretion system F family protein [Candidatus Omnitrophota bacterium]
MPKFNYVVKDRSGQTVKGDVEAADKSQALSMLRKKEFLILKLEKAKGGAMQFSFNLGGVKVKSEELSIFTRQLATIVESGIPVVNGLDILAEQTDNPGFNDVIRDVKESVNTGLSLSDALGKHPRVFPVLLVSMVRAGESSGMLDVVLDRVSGYMEKANALEKKVKSAMIYPAVIVLMATVITLVMILKVIPVFKDIFAGFGAELPAATELLINLSDFLRAYFLVFIGGVAAVIAAVKWYLGTPGGKLRFDRAKLRLPIVGVIFRKVAVSRFTRTLGTLLNSGVPILNALEIVSETSGNKALEKSVNEVRKQVKEGESISPPMERSGIFPPMVVRMISVGERSGELEKMLTKIANFYDEQVDTAVSGLTSLLEPLIIAFLGIVIGGIVFCMFLPIFKISQIINF